MLASTNAAACLSMDGSSYPVRVMQEQSKRFCLLLGDTIRRTKYLMIVYGNIIVPLRYKAHLKEKSLEKLATAAYNGAYPELISIIDSVGVIVMPRDELLSFTRNLRYLICSCESGFINLVQEIATRNSLNLQGLYITYRSNRSPRYFPIQVNEFLLNIATLSFMSTFHTLKLTSCQHPGFLAKESVLDKFLFSFFELPCTHDQTIVFECLAIDIIE